MKVEVTAAMLVKTLDDQQYSTNLADFNKFVGLLTKISDSDFSGVKIDVIQDGTGKHLVGTWELEL